jgi:spore coat polysaccharide biosynthesis protein SpsF (cytidylyltransferase family)
MTPNVVCIIQARMASQRFPGKVMEDIGGKTTIQRVVERIVTTGLEVAVALPPDGNNALANHLQRIGANHYRWPVPENDVLGRYAACAREYKADVVVRITGDCPLVDPVAIQGQVKRLLDTGAMYVSNIYPVRTVPSGFDVEVFTATALYVADALATNPDDREHVTPWIQQMFATETTVTAAHGAWPQRPHLSLDTPEDLALIRRVAEKTP